MKKLLNLAKEFSPSIIAIALPALALAQTGGGLQQTTGPTVTTGVPTTNISSLQDILNSLCVVFEWAFYFLLVLAVIFVIVAAFKYLTAAGEPEKVKSAGATLLYAAIAIGVALLARAVPLIVGSFLQSSGTLNTC